METEMETMAVALRTVTVSQAMAVIRQVKVQQTPEAMAQVMGQ